MEKWPRAKIEGARGALQHQTCMEPKDGVERTHQWFQESGERIAGRRES